MLIKFLQILTPEIVVVLAVSQVFGMLVLLFVIMIGYKLFKGHLEDSIQVQRELAQSVSESKNAISDLSNFLDGLTRVKGGG